MSTSLKVTGIRQLHRGLKNFDKAVGRELDQELRDAGQIVADAARSRFSSIDARSASGFRSRTKGFGRVVVEQQRRRTTGQHPEFGSLQMVQALLPARSEAEPQVIDAVENMLGRLAGRF